MDLVMDVLMVDQVAHLVHKHLRVKFLELQLQYLVHQQWQKTGAFDTLLMNLYMIVGSFLLLQVTHLSLKKKNKSNLPLHTKQNSSI